MNSSARTIERGLVTSAIACLMLSIAPSVAQAECITGASAPWEPYYQVRADSGASGPCVPLRAEAHVWINLWMSYLPCNSGIYDRSGKCIAGPLGGVDSRSTEPESCTDLEIWDEKTQTGQPYNSPILVPLTRSQDYELTSIQNGVSFDWDGDGVPERTAWTARNSRLAFLAIDVDSDGRITSGRELVGDRLVAGTDNGWEALTALAPPDVAILDIDYDLFRQLLLWEDRNHDGVSQPDELQPASNVLAELGLGYIRHNRRDRHGNKFVFEGRASVRTAPGKNRTVSHEEMVERNIKLYDVFFRTARY